MNSRFLIGVGWVVAGWLILAAPALADAGAPGVAAEQATTEDGPSAPAPAAAAGIADPDVPEIAAAMAEVDALAASVDPEIAPEVTVEPVANEAATAPFPTGPLGEMGYDSEGREGRIHIVVSGDTLWDISELYLGSAWVWPSIWRDNGEIENPHLIYPHERIWISATEMRRVTREEAAALLAGKPAAPRVVEREPIPAEPELIVFVPDERPTLRVSALEASDLVDSDQLDSAASIVDAVPNRMLLAQGDTVYIGLGTSETSVGDQFTVFRTDEPVKDPDTGHLLGYHINVVGWIEVLESDRETSRAKIVRSFAEVERGDRVMPRKPIDKDIVIGRSPTGVDGKLSFFADRRTLTSHIDFVYLNRGMFDGLAVGSPLEVYRRGYAAPERARNQMVRVPDRVVGQLIVVRTSGKSAVAFVANTNVELEVGDRFRGATGLPLVSSR